MIDTGAGVIDADYRGTVHVLLFNLSDKDYEGAGHFPAKDLALMLTRRVALCSRRRRSRCATDPGTNRDARSD